MNKYLLIVLFFLMGLSIKAFSDNLLEGFDAYNKKDFFSAYNKWLPLAEEGDFIAQHSLGILYKRGEGVSKNYNLSFKWFKLSAEQGYAFSQTALGDMYNNGFGIKKDNIKAFMWWYIAADQHESDAKTLLKILSTKMTGQDLEKAKNKVKICYRKNLKDC